MPVMKELKLLCIYLIGEFERCAIKCVDNSMDTLPNLFKTMKSVLAKGPSGIPDV